MLFYMFFHTLGFPKLTESYLPVKTFIYIFFSYQNIYYPQHLLYKISRRRKIRNYCGIRVLSFSVNSNYRKKTNAKRICPRLMSNTHWPLEIACETHIATCIQRKFTRWAVKICVLLFFWEHYTGAFWSVTAMQIHSFIFFFSFSPTFCRFNWNFCRIYNRVLWWPCILLRLLVICWVSSDHKIPWTKKGE